MALQVVQAAEETGLGLTLLPVFYAHSGFGGQAPTAGQARFVNDLDRFERVFAAACAAVSDLPGAVVGLAPHSLRAVTPQELSALVGLAGERPIHIHVAEQAKEVEDCLAWSGARPVEWLLANAPVDARWCLVHATHMTAVETLALARSDATAGLCPITEATLGDGLFPAPEFLAAGGAFGVGSDSNVQIDAAQELRLLEYGQRLSRRTRNILAPGPGEATGAALYKAAAGGGAQALGAPLPFFAVGAPADIVSLNPCHPGLVGRRGEAILDSFVFAGGRDLIDGVWRSGRKLVTGGRHHRREMILARYRKAMQRVLL